MLLESLKFFSFGIGVISELFYSKESKKNRNVLNNLIHNENLYFDS